MDTATTKSMTDFKNFSLRKNYNDTALKIRKIKKKQNKINNGETIFINQCYSDGNDDYNMNSITDNNNLENH